MSSKLAQLRATLESLESYSLPEKLAAVGSSINSSSTVPILNDNVVQRYQNARNAYLKRRMLQVFYDHVGTYDSSNGTFQLPPSPTDEQWDDLQDRRAALQDELKATASHVHRQLLALQSKHASFCGRRQELAHMISELEDENGMVDGSEDDDDDDASMDQEDDLDDDAFAREQQRLDDLTQQKAQLQATLDRLQDETAQARRGLEEAQRDVAEFQKARGITARAVSPETIEDMATETAAIQAKVRQLQEMTEWYDSVREVIEELGGIKIVKVQNATLPDHKVLLDVLLLGTHQVQVGMCQSETRPDALRVISATFLTSSLIVAQQVDSEDVNTATVQLHVPGFDDLVRLSANLGPVEDLRFVLREAIARIRTTVARVNELAHLRTRYLTKIGNTHQNAQFGGDDQEVVCSLNEGITVVLRLTPDCPLVDGSVYIDKIVGVGGWTDEVLDQLKGRIPPCRGPLAIMDAMRDEIRWLQEQQGLSLPSTPSMPLRKA